MTRRTMISMALVVVAVTGVMVEAAFASHSASDYDGDGHYNSVDNCPVDYNKLLGNSPQEWADWDKDGEGDVCDATPSGNNPDYTIYELTWYFLDANEEPHAGPVCSTITIFDPGWPPDDDTQCISNGEMDGVTWVVEGTSDESWRIDCAAGGSLSGVVEGGDKVVVLPLTPDCRISGTHLWGGLDDTVVRYAPLVYLHPDETLFPMDPGDFVTRSALKWAHDMGCDDHTVAREGRVDAAKLAGGGYSHQQSNREGVRQTCKDSGTYYLSSWYTRPNDGSPYKVNDQFDEGFYLDLNDSYRSGGPLWPRVYYDYEPGRYVTYWLFYAFNRPTAGPLGEVAEHEGDWERISVKLDANDEATAVAYFQHGCPPETYSWAEMQLNGYLNGKHPIAFAAQGSHASYPTLGDYSGPPCPETDIPAYDVVGRGRTWMTWTNLSDASNQSWYGFGGAWGHNGTTSETTGPLGPPHKAAAPAGW